MKLVLAPIADFTDSPFRQMCFAGEAAAARPRIFRILQLKIIGTKLVYYLQAQKRIF
jgi:tRNA-dihydrouridine synthase